MIYTIATNLRCEKKGKFLLPFYAKYTLYGTIDNFMRSFLITKKKIVYNRGTENLFGELFYARQLD